MTQLNFTDLPWKSDHKDPSAPKKILMIYGKDDLRMSAVYEHLQSSLPKHFLLEVCPDIDHISMTFPDEIIFLPVPVSLDQVFLSHTNISLLSFLDHCLSSCHIYGGGFPKSFVHKLQERQCSFTDLMADDSIALKNAVATAEGLIARIISDTPFNLQGASCLITGFGRCGRVIARKLRLLGAKVQLVLRRGSSSQALAWSEGFPYCFPETLSQMHTDLLINTVPEPMIDAAFLKKTTPHLAYEIASLPGGYTKEATALLKDRLHRLPGLPGIYSPVSSGKILAEAFLSYIKQERL